MDRADGDQEGITLAPANYLRTIAREEANKAILTHLPLCPVNASRMEERLRGLEVRFALMVGLMLGAGLLGGAAGAVVAKLFPH